MSGCQVRKSRKKLEGYPGVRSQKILTLTTPASQPWLTISKTLEFSLLLPDTD